MDKDYITFTEEVLIGLANEQEPPGLDPIDIDDMCDRQKIEALPTWLDLVCSDLESQGYGKDLSTKDGPCFLLNGLGLRRATELRRNQKPTPLLQRLHSVNWTTWVGVATILGFVLTAITIFIG